jgi:hypothetical protein
MSYRVGRVAVKSNPQEKEQVLEVFEVPQMSSLTDNNFSFEQVKL